MKANGFGRPPNDPWTTIPTSRKHICTFKHLVDATKHKNLNPYDILHETTSSSLNKIDLPNGEMRYTTFRSIHELAAYFSKFPIHMHYLQGITNTHLKKQKTHFPTKIPYGDNICASYKLKNTLHINTHNPSHTRSNPQIPDSETISFAPKSSTMASNTITAAITDIYGEIDIEHVHIDTARSMCKKVCALLFLSMPEWIDIDSMDSPTLRKTLKHYKVKNQERINIIEKEGEDDPQNMTYVEAMILDDSFEIEHLYYASVPTLKQMAQEVVNFYSFPFDITTLNDMNRTQIICQIYELLYLVLEHQGFAQGGVVVCPDTSPNEETKKN